MAVSAPFSLAAQPASSAAPFFLLLLGDNCRRTARAEERETAGRAAAGNPLRSAARCSHSSAALAIFCPLEVSTLGQEQSDGRPLVAKPLTEPSLTLPLGGSSTSSHRGRPHEGSNVRRHTRKATHCVCGGGRRVCACVRACVRAALWSGAGRGGARRGGAGRGGSGGGGGSNKRGRPVSFQGLPPVMQLITGQSHGRQTGPQKTHGNMRRHCVQKRICQKHSELGQGKPIQRTT